MSEKTRIDGVQLALLSNRLEGISSKMGNTPHAHRSLGCFEHCP